MDASLKNAIHLEQEFSWLEGLIEKRIKGYFAQERVTLDELAGVVPYLNGHVSGYSSFLYGQQLELGERLMLLLSLAPYLRPQSLDLFQSVRRKSGRLVTEFGGVPMRHTPAFLPTGETLLFLLSGGDVQARLHHLHLLDPSHPLLRMRHVELRSPGPGEPHLNGILQPSRELIDAFTTGRPFRPEYSADFPAKRITSPLTWKDLVLVANPTP